MFRFGLLIFRGCKRFKPHPSIHPIHPAAIHSSFLGWKKKPNLESASHGWDAVTCLSSKRDHLRSEQKKQENVVSEKSYGTYYVYIYWLVVSTHLKNISQNGNLPPGKGEHKRNWNHHLEKTLSVRNPFPRQKKSRLNFFLSQWNIQDHIQVFILVEMISVGLFGLNFDPKFQVETPF